MNKFNEENIQLLIDLVREKPLLYDKGHPHYKKTDCKDKVWKEIAKKMHSNEKDCKTAWRSLRDQFIRCRKEYKGKTGQAAEETKKKYKNFERLLFLCESLEPRAHCSNYEMDETLTESVVDYEESIGFDECSGNSECEVFYQFEAAPSQSFQSVPLPKTSPMSTTSTSSSTSSGKRKKDDDGAEHFKEFLNTLSAQIAIKEPDGVDMFFSSLSETVKQYNLSPSNMTILKRDIMIFVTEKLQSFEMSKE